MSGKSSQLNTIGGQAVIEGIMMRGKTSYAMSVRKSDGSIATIKNSLRISESKHKFFRLAIVRGVFVFIESLLLGMKIITQSAELAGLDVQEEEPSKFEKFLIDKFGEKKITNFILYLSVAIAIIMGIGLFMLLPVIIGSLTSRFIGENTWALGIVEGFTRIAIFIVYILLISQMKDIQRMFEYHGAEHKAINCLEHNEELTVENIKKHSRLHKRCGTSFLIIVMLVSMVIFLFLQTKIIWLRFALRILLVPLIAGISYEIIRLAGRSDSIIVKIVSAPGMWMQRLTTSEPDDSQIEVAIEAINEVLKNEQK